MNNLIYTKLHKNGDKSLLLSVRPTYKENYHIDILKYFHISSGYLIPFKAQNDDLRQALNGKLLPTFKTVQARKAKALASSYSIFTNTEEGLEYSEPDLDTNIKLYNQFIKFKHLNSFKAPNFHKCILLGNIACLNTNDFGDNYIAGDIFCPPIKKLNYASCSFSVGEFELDKLGLSKDFNYTFSNCNIICGKYAPAPTTLKGHHIDLRWVSIPDNLNIDCEVLHYITGDINNFINTIKSTFCVFECKESLKLCISKLQNTKNIVINGSELVIQNLEFTNPNIYLFNIERISSAQAPLTRVKIGNIINNTNHDIKILLDKGVVLGYNTEVTQSNYMITKEGKIQCVSTLLKYLLPKDTVE